MGLAVKAHITKILMIVVMIFAILLIILGFLVAAFDSTASAYGYEFDGMVGDTVEEKLWWAMHDAGFDDIRTASMMGNIYQESHFDYKSGDYEGSNGLGFCGWLYAYLGDNLVDYAKKEKGEDWPSAETQIEFISAWHARQGPAVEYVNDSEGPIEGGSYTYFGITYPAGEWLNYKTTSDTDADLDYCTMAYCANYERCGEWEIRDDVRKKAAKDYYKQFHGKSRPQPKRGTGNEKASNTAGIKGYYTALCSGRTYTEYWQNIVGTPWYWDYGCWVCTQATIMSGFGAKYTPNQLPGFHANAQQYTWKQFGNCQYERVYNVKASDIVKYLKQGEAIHIRVEGRTLITDNGNHPFDGHSLSLLDYKRENGKDLVYLHDPWDGDPTYGWTNVNTLANCLIWYEHIWQ